MDNQPAKRRQDINDITELREFITSSIARERVNEHYQGITGSKYKTTINTFYNINPESERYTEFVRYFTSKYQGSYDLYQTGAEKFIKESKEKPNASGISPKPYFSRQSSKTTWISVNGDWSQTISKAYTARASTKRGAGMAWGQIAAGGLALAGAVFPGFGIFESLALRGAAALGGAALMTAGANSGRQSELSYEAIPYREEVELLWMLGFNKATNNGSSVFLSHEKQWFPDAS